MFNFVNLRYEKQLMRLFYNIPDFSITRVKGNYEKQKCKERLRKWKKSVCHNIFYRVSRIFLSKYIVKKLALSQVRYPFLLGRDL